MTPEEIARKSAEAMRPDDRAPAAIGVVVETVGPGEAVASMVVTAAMANGHGTCHGGYLFALADTAFAYACNSYNQRAVAQHCAISFLTPAQIGMKLVATARERHRAERSGIYDVEVTADGVAIAEFRGHSRTVPGKLF
ncbi:hydroxyphenylacetyl-CoA thioesterase PaaI [Blastochloris viridis]|uniref:Acyl-coenzyme A thioesterase PaaI n=1 Tax=Blastochloris viridis TaxID=1079 RepID=A0A0H5B8E8_BLAVI|nr:hydroxyphenylacetyl-CoA thioesterase PaaI [Blastochloris viridis]ALK08262.1 Acyl-coenzyme A thioesterase PaaI [Blastochloris viridis]BAR98472.1 phenylacetic acid degradation protein PaaD [Blastochloris viridis]CUU44184.1 Acyl-coenzyme A thioesterase PaaI [Blastochloris viridis]